MNFDRWVSTIRNFAEAIRNRGEMTVKTCEIEPPASIREIDAIAKKWPMGLPG